ncbi:hypothetical protein ACWKWC_24830, partial [Geodermatophilus nigrescens]
MARELDARTEGVLWGATALAALGVVLVLLLAGGGDVPAGATVPRAADAAAPEAAGDPGPAPAGDGAAADAPGEAPAAPPAGGGGGAA